jgi:2-octaprenylphenol hydroxylase
MIQSYDLAIVGGGIVGLTLASSLADSHLSIALIEGNTPNVSNDDVIGRVSAISFASQTIFEKLGIWQLLDTKRITAYDTMKVWDQDSAAKIDFDAKQVAREQLGYIIENEQIENALLNSVEKQSNVTVYCPEQLTDIAIGDGESWLTLASKETLTAKLVVAADGANSWLRNKVEIPLVSWDYDHHAIVATVKTELPHQHCARQIFTPEGPLAFLPLFEQNLSSIVWSVPPEKAAFLIGLPDSEFNKYLARAFDNCLGTCEVTSKRQSFPLTMRYARDFAKHRIALIGDAAHTIHPLAGQGLNLGLLDALSLSQILIDNNEANKDIGHYQHLRQFERWRKSEALQMIAAMEILKRLFTGRNPIQKGVRDLALNFTDKLSPLKKQFIKQAMGLTGELPNIVK